MFGGGPFGSIPYGSVPIARTFPSAGLPEKPWILTGILSDLATFESVDAPLMPVANLQNQEPSKKFRANGTSAKIRITFPYPVPANALGWVGHNHSAAGQFRIRAFTSAANMLAETSADYDSGWQSVWPLGVKPQVRSWSVYTSILRFTNYTSYQYWLYEVSDGGPGLTYTQGGRFMLNRAWQSARFPDHSLRMGATSTDSRIRSSRNALYPDGRPRARRFMLPFSVATPEDALDFAGDLNRENGTATDLICCIDPAATSRFHQYTIHGLLSETVEAEGIPLFDGAGVQQWKFSLSIDELLT